MIQIEKEPKELFQEFGVYEFCYFCQGRTDTRHEETNTPICNYCAEKKDVSDIYKHTNTDY